MSAVLALAAGAASALAAWCGVATARRACAAIAAFEDGPPASEPPVRAIVAGAALLGAAVALRAHDLATLVLVVGALWAFAAAWCSDALRGVIPDAFTLAPLALAVLAALARHDPSIVLAAFVPALPFAFSAWRSRGLGMGWGDVKLVALAGAVLGAPLALLVCACACVSAALVHSRRAAQPLAFGPYLAGAAALALPLAAALR